MLKVLTKYDRRALLCEALRSGKYRQGMGATSTHCKYEPCVIGVGRLIGIFEGDMTTIYPDVLRKIDLSPWALYEKNDAGWTFEKIADWIEAQP